MENITQKQKLFTYLALRGYDKKWSKIYTDIRHELIDMGVEDASKVSQMSYHLMNLRGKMMELMTKIKNEFKFFGYDTETEADELFIEFIGPMAEEIDQKLPLKGSES